MEHNEQRSQSRNSDVEQADLAYYLPGTPTVSSKPGRVERFVRKLFRRRGTLRPVVRNNR